MRHKLAVALLGLLMLGAKGEESCPIPSPAVDRAALLQRLSTNAETVAPRRRAVQQPTSSKLPIANFIDTWIAAKQTRERINPTALCTDEEFLRRVSLDLAGRIPDPAEVRAFLADAKSDKRARKVDELLASDAFVDRWTMWFGDLVQNVQVANNSREYYIGRNAYHQWIRDSIAARKPYDVMVRELLAGSGDSFVSGTANYAVRQLQTNGPPQDTYDNLAAHSSEKFLGMPMLCLSCHSGPAHLEQVNGYLAKKKRDDFWRMAAFFAQTAIRPVRTSDPANPNANVVKHDVRENLAGAYRLNTTDGNKTPRQPSSGQPNVVAPAFLLSGDGPRTGESWRDAYGRLLTADRQFARATVNLLWKELFGLGIVEPVNAFDLSKLETQATHPELLEALASEWIARNCDLRAILRTMVTSSTYQLSAVYTPGAWNEAWVPAHARRYPRRLMAEMLLDAITKATTVPLRINVQGSTTPIDRAMLLPDPLEGRRAAFAAFLDTLGRGDRDDVARTNDSSIAQALALLNDPVVTHRVRRNTQGSTVARILASTNDPAAITDELYLATLSRFPRAEEKALAVAHLRGGSNLGERSEDLQFALINSVEFLFN